jgi:hypothetical protein
MTKLLESETHALQANDKCLTHHLAITRSVFVQLLAITRHYSHRATSTVLTSTALTRDTSGGFTITRE